MFDSNGDIRIAELIRTDVDCGICSYVWTTVNAVFSAFRRGYVSIVNFQDMFYPQFHDERTTGKVNIWEDYFRQPCGISLDDVKGQTIESIRYVSGFELDASSLMNRRIMTMMALSPSDYVSYEIDKVMSKLDIEHTLGVLVRGTDYRSVHPKYHPVQPELSDVISDIRKTADIHGLTTVFVVSDEKEYAERIGNETGLSVIHNQHDFISNHSSSLNSGVMRNMDYETKKRLNADYLSNVIVLSKLKYNILSNTSALNAYDYFRLNEDKAVYEKRYNLGNY